MKLRNKKTGEIITLKDEGELALLKLIENSLPNGLSLWEEVKEPLIKDKKIRKAVRAWAEAIGEKDNLVLSNNMEYHDCCIYDGDLGNTALIDFGVDLDIEENDYTLAELCGEEEE